MLFLANFPFLFFILVVFMGRLKSNNHLSLMCVFIFQKKKKKKKIENASGIDNFSFWIQESPCFIEQFFFMM